MFLEGYNGDSYRFTGREEEWERLEYGLDHDTAKGHTKDGRFTCYPKTTI